MDPNINTSSCNQRGSVNSGLSRAGNQIMGSDLDPDKDTQEIQPVVTQALDRTSSPRPEVEASSSLERDAVIKKVKSIREKAESNQGWREGVEMFVVIVFGWLPLGIPAFFNWLCDLNTAEKLEAWVDREYKKDLESGVQAAAAELGMERDQFVKIANSLADKEVQGQLQILTISTSIGVSTDNTQ